MTRATKPELSINAAVMNCVAHCADSQSPAVVVGDYLEKLKAMGWDDASIAAVRRDVLPLLGDLKNGDTVSLGRDSLSSTKIIQPSEPPSS